MIRRKKRLLNGAVCMGQGGGWMEIDSREPCSGKVGGGGGGRSNAFMTSLILVKASYNFREFPVFYNRLN